MFCFSIFYDSRSLGRSCLTQSSCLNDFHQRENNANECFDGLDDFAMNAVLPTHARSEKSECQQLAASKKSECLQLLAFSIAQGKTG
jgi:hypothetical protein